MSLKLNHKYVSSLITPEDLAGIQPAVDRADHLLRTKTGAGGEMTAWVDHPEQYDREEYARIKKSAEYIRNNCDILIVIGIGGSYLGARAVIEYLKSPNYNSLKKDTPDIYFAGNNISSTYLNELLALCEGKELCVNVISKSGTTTEPAVAFRVFRALMEEKYGKEGAKKRIFVTTDREKGTLKEFSTKAGYETFVVPDDIGGRFSVLTAVGLLPIAAAGIDIDQLMAGAAHAKRRYVNTDINDNACYRYAAIRYLLYKKGKSMEVLAGYEPCAAMFHEWWKQLYGESEGKDFKGLFPVSVVYSTDLHSLGQFIQEGTRIMFETVLNIEDTKTSFKIPNDPDNVDGLNFLSGMELDEVKKMAMQGTVLAHVDGGVPNLIIDISEKSEYALGELIYFFELACAISGYLLEVNPFNQRGVESYKKNMFALLGKPGYEEMRKTLLDRLKN